MRVELRSGRGVVGGTGTALDALHAAAGTPITARSTWLQAWVDSFTAYTPTAVLVEGSAGDLDAAVMLAVRPGRFHDEFVSVGHGPSDVIGLPARSAAAAEEAARATAAFLRSRRRPWQLTLRHLAADDLVAPRLAAELRHSRMVPGDVSPVLRAHSGTALRSYVSSGHHRGIRRLRNRMVRHGLDPTVAHLHEAADVRRLLPDLERIYRARDVELGRRSALDHPGQRAFFRRVLEDHAARGDVSLTTLELTGELAAYTLCFVDGASYRMWNCRFDPRWGRYSPGKLAMDEAVAHALEQRCETFDFMRGDEPYKASYANAEDRTVDLFASSGLAGRTALDAFLAARAAARSLDASGGPQAELVRRLRRTAERIRR